ncbi:hypothetical protein EJB05_41659 [Eragrostis curvula]|uniref:Uncharacterized protein n=1 Tax=Eragrostis curvula TaxID=38414 RepID=A0A5J9TAB7_9POAL|nr:hypothetical protein EJB05_41659 [Eragrostis curvula]
MTAHCVPACHGHCASSSSSSSVPVIYYPSSASTSTSTARSGGGGGASSSAAAAPLLEPQPAEAACDPGVWLGVGLCGLVVLAFILVIMFGTWTVPV